MFKQISRVQHIGDGEIHLLPRRLMDHLFRIRFLTIMVKATIANADVASQMLTSEGFFHNSKLSMFYRDGKPMIRSVPFRVMEWHNQLVRRGYPDALVECADVNITAINGGTQEVVFYLEVPFELPFARDPRSFEQSLSLIGPLILAIGATGNANLSVQQVESTITAHGRQERTFFSGIRQLLSVHGGQAPLTTEDMPLSKRRLVNLMAYTKNNAISPLAATKPKATVDETEVILNAPNINVVDLLKYYGQRGDGAALPARSTLTQTKVAAVIMAPSHWEMGKLPWGNTLKLEYDTNAATAGDHFYLHHELASKADACRSIYPGADRLGVEGLPGVTEYEKLSAGDVVPSRLVNWLPENIRVSETGGACSVSPLGE